MALILHRESYHLLFNSCIYCCWVFLLFFFFQINLFTGCCQRITEASPLFRFLCSLSRMIHFFGNYPLYKCQSISIWAGELLSPLYYGCTMSPRQVPPNAHHESLLLCCVSIFEASCVALCLCPCLQSFIFEEKWPSFVPFKVLFVWYVMLQKIKKTNLV